MDRERYRPIAAAIATCANQLLPEDVRAREEHGDIAVSVRGQSLGAFGVASVMADESAHLTSALVASVAANLLNWLQDIVSEDRRQPWPPAPGQPPSHMAAYRADHREGVLRMWFEAGATPVTPIAEAPLTLELGS